MVINLQIYTLFFKNILWEIKLISQQDIKIFQIFHILGKGQFCSCEDFCSFSSRGADVAFPHP